MKRALNNNIHVFLICVLCTVASVQILFAQAAKPVVPVVAGSDGKLVYTADELGNRIPDFSFCGYMAGERPIPNVAVQVRVPVKSGDATKRIQRALDYVSSLPINKEGFRGAVLLEKGVYELSGSLKITTSGVVLRGSGMGPEDTRLLGAGTSRETLIQLSGTDNRKSEPPVKIEDSYVPVNSISFNVVAPHSFKAGDNIQVSRPSTKEWIQKLGMEEYGGETGWIGWKPGQRDIAWLRVIKKVEGNKITLDAPLTTALDATYGGGTAARYNWPGIINQSGVENLRCISMFDTSNPKDEDHRWMAIVIQHVRDAWVRRVTFQHFAGSAVAVYETASRITVEDCKSLDPVSEIGGQRRYTFFNNGQQALFQRLYAEHGYHDFGMGFCAAGPNAFVQCESVMPYSFSGPIDSWASGALYDIVNVDAQQLGFWNHGEAGQGTGWNAANSVLWQCTAAKINCYKPPMANNWAFGAWAQFAGDGYWNDNNSHVKPRSLYYAQLADRIGNDVLLRSNLLPVETEASSSPTFEQAAELIAGSSKPAIILADWVDEIVKKSPIALEANGVKTVDQVTKDPSIAPPQVLNTTVSNGWLVHGNSILTGRRTETPWWRGNIRPFEWDKAKAHITRFVPGRVGNGLTDDLQEVADFMKSKDIVAIEHNYALWYERRRDDHERVRRMDGDVWPPFYELPFARSGKELAWDGLSKYDLKKYNVFYWSRLKQFADLADQKGLLLIHQHYFQHNILEAGAHYADFPWRPANNINNTGFPEPPPYAGDKRIFLAEQFYDINHPVRRQLHRAYIRKCLDNFSGNTAVIQLISAEFTGPLHFVEFWIDIVSEWEKETGKNAIIGLSTTKDVQDAILSDPVRSAAIDLIDIRYWYAREDGTLYAPPGGKNLAPRQHARLVKPGHSSFAKVYESVREYKQKHPDKAVIYSADGGDNYAWAVFMAGGSLAAIPKIDHPEFLTEAVAMKPADNGDKNGRLMLSNPEKGFIIYSQSNSSSSVQIDLTKMTGVYNLRWINPTDGRILKEDKALKAGGMNELKSPKEGEVIVWASKSKGS